MSLVSIFFLSSISTCCPEVELQTNPPVNLTEYTRSTWYVQKQQINGYQKENSLYCVAATYNITDSINIPFYNNKVVAVYNYANLNKVNGISSNNSTILCARIPNASHPEKLLVAPCFLPNVLAGPYWILAAGPSSDNYEWAIVIGGQPSVRVSNTTCTTKISGINNSGLWLFSRKTILPQDDLKQLYNILESKNISSSQLIDVKQENCQYNGAYIKK